MANTTGQKYGGRKKGTPNKTTKEIRDGFQLLVENKLDKMEAWLDRVAERDPARALELISKLTDFVIPKLSRNEIKDMTYVEDFLEMTPEERQKRIEELQKKLSKGTTKSTK